MRSTELFKDAVRRLIEDPSWIKGPYVQLGLPFVAGTRVKHFFEDFETEHQAFLHQAQAWRRHPELAKGKRFPWLDRDAGMAIAPLVSG